MDGAALLTATPMHRNHLDASVRYASFGLTAAIMLATSASADIVFVNAGQILPTALQTGASWAFAFKSLQDGLDAVGVNDELWVAAGTYKPTTGTDRSATFALPPGAKVLGGFQPGDATIFDQDPVANVTILSGAIGGAGTSDNSFHVVTANAAIGGAVLDGFTITGGTANGAGVDGVGAGATATGAGSTTFSRCRFVGNLGGSGGGASCTGPAKFSACSFEENTTDGGGAGLRINSIVNVVSCSFIGNESLLAGSAGGAIFLLNANTSTVSNCVFDGNSADATGGAIRANSSDITISGCTFAANTAISGGAVAIGAGSDVSVFNSIFSGNSGGGSPDILVSGGTATVQLCLIGGSFAGNPGCFAGDPLFVDADGVDDIAGNADDDLSLRPGSPSVDAGSFAQTLNDQTDLDGDGNTSEKVPFDIGGGLRFVDDVRKNSGVGTFPYVDIGAHELERDVTVWCVDASAAPGGFGATWDSPFSTVQQAFDAVLDIKFGGPAEIWVADGTYKPTTTTDRTKSFDIPDGARLFGGFTGVEGGRFQRNWIANPSILSGDIGAATSADNSFHVVTTDGASNFIETCLDGFVVTAGNANGAGDSAIGGGVFARNSGSLRVRNSRIIANNAISGGGVGSKGGGSLLVTGCLISGNSAVNGGGTYAEDCLVSLFHDTIVENVASAQGGGVFSKKGGFFTSISVGSSILWFNESSEDGQLAQMNVGNNGSISCNFSSVQCFDGLFDNGFNFGGNPRLADHDGSDDIAGTLDDSAAIAANSPCIDAGSTSAAALMPDYDDLDEDGVTNEVIPVDLLGNPRNLNDIGSLGDTFMEADTGAVEFQGTSGPAPSPADLNGDGTVDGADLGLLLSNFGGPGPVGDLNQDCLVDGADLGILLSAWM